jgi:hypothetical protein
MLLPSELVPKEGHPKPDAGARKVVVDVQVERGGWCEAIGCAGGLLGVISKGDVHGGEQLGGVGVGQAGDVGGLFVDAPTELGPHQLLDSCLPGGLFLCAGPLEHEPFKVVLR